MTGQELITFGIVVAAAAYLFRGYVWGALANSLSLALLRHARALPGSAKLAMWIRPRAPASPCGGCGPSSSCKPRQLSKT